MTAPRIHRFDDLPQLAAYVTGRLFKSLEEVQSRQPLVQLCLCGGRTASAVYQQMASQFPATAVDPSRLELWWSDDRYVSTEDPARYAGQALALLAGTFPLSTARTHLMPARIDNLDVDDAALEYATELADTSFDICLLSIGEHGDIASLRASDHVDLGALVSGVQDWDNEPWERLTLTPEAINRSKEVWVMASGEKKAQATARALQGNPEVAASLVHGTQATHWFIDEAAASQLPYYRCAW